MTPNKQQITTDEEIMNAHDEAFNQVRGYAPMWIGDDRAILAKIFRKMMERYELVNYRVKGYLGEVVQVTEENGSVSRFVNVAADKWYCDGRPTGSRFLNTQAIQRMNPRPA